MSKRSANNACGCGRWLTAVGRVAVWVLMFCAGAPTVRGEAAAGTGAGNGVIAYDAAALDRDMLRVPGGVFLYGMTPEEKRQAASAAGVHLDLLRDHSDRRTLAVPAFWIDRYPVTRGLSTRPAERARQGDDPPRFVWPGTYYATGHGNHHPGGARPLVPGERLAHRSAGSDCRSVCGCQPLAGARQRGGRGGAVGQPCDLAIL